MFHHELTGLPANRNPRCLGRQKPATSRRGFLQGASMGFGWLAFGDLAILSVKNYHTTPPPALGAGSTTISTA